MTTPSPSRPEPDAAAAAIRSGATALGIEFGSTRIKLCLVMLDSPSVVLGSGGHNWENRFEDRRWTYSAEQIWSGVQAAYAELSASVERDFGIRPRTFGALGVSAMMHGYLAFDEADELLVPFRTWRNTTTAQAAHELTDAFGQNLPQRWSVSHLRQAILDDEPHITDVAHVTTLAGYVHWRLTGRKVLGVGDASGMFPIDAATQRFDERMLARFDELVAGAVPPLVSLLPEVLTAGEPAGELTAEGAALLDPTGALQPGIPMCPPEGDAGTGMVATNAVRPRAGNISVGTSVFAMVVLEHPLRELHPELDLVTTPAGDPVAMVHCNNGASELEEWVGLFERFAEVSGTARSRDSIFETLFREALEGDADAGGLLAYNYLAGEHIVALSEGRPLFVRTPDSRFTLANLMRAQLYGVFATLALGMQVLAGEGVEVDRMYAHGGVFRTAGIAQRFLAAAIDAPVAVGKTASEGGAWGIAVLAAYRVTGLTRPLSDYLEHEIFVNTESATAAPESTDRAGFIRYLDAYRAGLAAEVAAIRSL
jgi:sugar (pentulose or hexulose) kinase